MSDPGSASVPSEPSDEGAVVPPPAAPEATTAPDVTVPPPPPAPYGQSTPAYPGAVDASKKVPAGILGILLGSLGIHKFILGYKTEGLIMLLVTVLTCGIGSIVMGPIGLIEGIIYLTKSDDEFYNTYIANKKGWF